MDKQELFRQRFRELYERETELNEHELGELAKLNEQWDYASSLWITIDEEIWEGVGFDTFEETIKKLFLRGLISIYPFEIPDRE